ncbi:MAG: HIT domain-containing protein [Chloroflexi bacterium]|nr:HIT domain-containing protein [Chloroflexota bacterium]
MDTIFGKIVRGEVSADIVYRDEHVTAFRDAHPQAPTHILVVPNQPVASLAEIDQLNDATLAALLRAAASIARQAGLDDGGYRVVINTGVDAGQSVAHLHLHVLGGRSLGWPPG